MENYNNYNKLTRQQKLKIAFLAIKFRRRIVEKFNIKTSNLKTANDRIRFIKLGISVSEFRKNLIEKYAVI